MVGLVSRDMFIISWPQYSVMACITAGSLYAASRRLSGRFCGAWGVTCLVALWSVFRGHMIGIDVLTTWQQIPRLSWPGWWSELGFVNYLKLQPPLWTAFLLLAPSYPLQQVFALLFGGLILACAYVMHGPTLTGLLLACPLFQLLSIQPSNDLLACCCLCLFAAVSHRQTILAVLTLWLACSVKYTAYVMIFPLLFISPLYAVSLAVFIMMYWWTALHAVNAWWPTEQWRYLSAQFLFQSYFIRTFVNGKSVSHGMPIGRILRRLRWNWLTQVKPALLPLTWYVFPWYVCPSSWVVWLTGIGILAGYGNIKYVSLVFPIFLMTYKS